MYLKYLVFLFLSWSAFCFGSEQFAQFYSFNGFYKEDLKIFSTGLVKLYTSSFGGGCSDIGGEFQKRFQVDEVNRVLNLISKAKMYKDNQELDSEHTIVFKADDNTNFINTNLNQKLLSEIRLENSFIKSELGPRKALKIYGKKTSSRSLEIILEKVGEQKINLKIPKNINSILKILRSDIKITSHQVREYKDKFLLVLRMSGTVDDGSVVKLDTTNLLGAGSPLLTLCATI